MSKFKVGDRVRIKIHSSPSAFSASTWPKGLPREGFIDSKAWTKVTVHLDDGSKVYCHSYDLEKM